MKHLLAACLLLIVGAATPAFAQWTFDAAVGEAAPTSNSGFRTGLDLMGAVEQRLVQQVPFALRLELGWDRSLTRYAFDAVVDPTLRSTRFQPYALAGFGLYTINVSKSNQTNFGINFGGGLRYPIGPVQPFVETRYHIDYAPLAAIRFIPFQFGVRIPMH